MTLNITVAVPDGLVIASDSLASQVRPYAPAADFGVECNNCGHKTPGRVQLPAIGIPQNSSPLAQKLFYVGNYGVAFWGASCVGGRTVCNHVLNYACSDFCSSKTVQNVADDLYAVFMDALRKEAGFAEAADDHTALGFQIVGYNRDDLDEGTRLTVHVAKSKKVEVNTGHGGAFSGDARVAIRLCRHIANEPQIGLMTLPDAVDFARFLIQATADAQRFSEIMPTVGGAIDIAIITKWAGLRWVQRKTLLGPDDVRLNIGKLARELATVRQGQNDLRVAVEGLSAHTADESTEPMTDSTPGHKPKRETT